MHSSQAPPAVTSTKTCIRGLGACTSRLLGALHAALAVSVKLRLNALWCISGLVCLFVRPVSLGYNAVWSCRFFRSQKLVSISVSLSRLSSSHRIATHRYSSLLIANHLYSSILVVAHRYLSHLSSSVWSLSYRVRISTYRDRNASCL